MTDTTLACTGPFSRAVERFVRLADSGALGCSIVTEDTAVDMMLQALDEEQPCAPELLRCHFEGVAWCSTDPTGRYRWLKIACFGARLGSVDRDEIGNMVKSERQRLEATLPQETLNQIMW